MRAIAVWALVGAAVLVTLISALGVLVMRDPLQKLHYISPPATLGVSLIAAALFLGEPDPQAGAKAVFVALLLLGMNAVATHATARAARIRDHGTLTPRPAERIPVIGEWRFAGETAETAGTTGPTAAEAA